MRPQSISVALPNRLNFATLYGVDLIGGFLRGVLAGAYMGYSLGYCSQLYTNFYGKDGLPGTVSCRHFR